MLYEVITVQQARVNFALETVQVLYDSTRGGPVELCDRVAELGYQASPADPPADGELRFAIRGMTCANCALTIEKKLGALAGVSEVRVNP